VGRKTALTSTTIAPLSMSLPAVTVEFLCHIESMACTLRIIDRFRVNADGRITAQENFFDPRDVTNPP